MRCGGIRWLRGGNVPGSLHGCTNPGLARVTFAPALHARGVRRESTRIRFIDERANAVTAAFRWLWAQSLIGHAVSGSLWRVDLSCPRRFSATRVGYLDRGVGTLCPLLRNSLVPNC